MSLFDYTWDLDEDEVTDDKRHDVGVRDIVVEELNKQFHDKSLMITLKTNDDGYYQG